MSALRNKGWEKFCLNVATKGMGDEKAYIAAGYSERGARQAANRLRQNVDIQERITELEVKVTEVAVESAGIDKAWVLSELQSLYEANVGELLVHPKDGGAPYYDLSKATPEQLKSIDSLQIDTACIGKGEEAQQVLKIKVQMSKRLDILKAIGDHVDVGAFKQLVGHSGTVGLTQILQELDGESTGLPHAGGN